MMDSDKYMILLTSNKLVKGAKRTAICDIQRGKLQIVPNDIYDFVEKHNKTTIKQIKSHYEKSEHETVDEYLNFLKQKEFVFFGSLHDTQIIKDVRNDWYFPSNISHAVIEYSSQNFSNDNDILKQLELLECKAVQIVSYNEIVTINIINNIMKRINKCNYLTSIEFIIPHSKKYTKETVKELLKQNLRIDKFILHSCKEKGNYNLENGTSFAFINQKVQRACCGVISQEYFSFNKFQFNESQHFNSCLNQKVSIDIDGNIKNCPSMIKSYGNIKNIPLKECVSKKNFKIYWEITKDQIDICKECEFRYICTDCRAYIENPKDIFSKPLKCGYNPYTNKWEDWSKNPLKQKAIEYYELSSLTK